MEFKLPAQSQQTLSAKLQAVLLTVRHATTVHALGALMATIYPAANAMLALPAAMVFTLSHSALPLLIPSVLQDVQLIAPLAITMASALVVIITISLATADVLLARLVIRAMLCRPHALRVLTLSV